MVFYMVMMLGLLAIMWLLGFLIGMTYAESNLGSKVSDTRRSKKKGKHR